MGDSLRCDVAGAKSADLAAIWIHAHGVEKEHCEVQPDFVVDDLRDLLEA